jgi:hypothetical protein
MGEIAGAFAVILVLGFGLAAACVVVCLIIAPLRIWIHTGRSADALVKLTATQYLILKELEKLNAQAARHSNADVACPGCGQPITLTDGRGTCPGCRQPVRA